MSNSQLLDTTYSDGLQSPYFVNGRLLSAEDLRSEQKATFQRLSWLGKAAGHGVVEGLMASKLGSTTVQVTSGLGLNRQGQLVRLPGPITLNLAPAGDPGLLQPAANGHFQNCQFDATTTGGPGQDGAYLLAVQPVSRLEGQAPVQKAAGALTAPGCAYKWEVDGLQFKAIRLLDFGTGGSGATTSNRRNLLAHWCYGSQALRRLPLDPFIFSDDFTGLDTIPGADLSACDLPLAVFYWRNGKLDFVEPWPARRRLVQPGPWQTWRGSLADMRVAVAQARFLQFQGEINRLLAGGSAGSAQATTFFRYLPPVGYLPIRPPDFLVRNVVQDLLKAAVGGSGALAEAIGLIAQNLNLLVSQVQNGLPQSGFDLQTFFGEAMPASVQLIDGESVDFYLQHSWYDEAIDLQGETRFDIYLVADVWRRMVGQQLVDLIVPQLGLAGMASNYRQALMAGIKQAMPPEIPGGQDRSYALFVKQVAPKRSISVGQAVVVAQPGLTGNFEVWHSYAGESPAAVALQDLVVSLQKTNPGLTIELSAHPELIQQLMVAVPAGEGPDLVLVDNTQIAGLVEAAVIQPVDAVAKVDNAVANVAYTSLTLGKQLYGIPQSLEAAALLYNRALVPQPPADHKTLLFRTRFLQGQVAFPEEIYFHYGFIPAFGGKIIDKSGRSIADRGSGVADVMVLLGNLQEAGAKFLPYPQAQESFLAQDSALMIDTATSLDVYREALGDGLGVAPLPAGTVDAAHPLLRVEGYAVPAFSRSLADSVALAELLTNAKAQGALAKAANKVPVRGDVALNDEVLLQFMALSAETQPWPTQPQFIAFWQPFQQMMDEVIKTGRDPAAAVVDATRKMNQANGFG